MGAIRRLGLALVLVVVVAFASGCGSSDSSTVAETTGKPKLYPWLKGPSREFLIRGGDNVVQTFGREATNAERAQANEVIQAWMKARAAQDWARDCSYFSRRYIHALITTDAMRVSHGKVKNCAQGLAFFGHRASGSYKNTLTGPIDSLRVGGGNGYAQYHGNNGHDFVVTVERENGKWWVSIASPLGRSS